MYGKKSYEDNMLENIYFDPEEPEGKIDSYKGTFVSLSYKCNTDICSYCYARKQKVEGTISTKDFRTIVEWISKISNNKDVFFLGGEPTIIPNLTEYFDILGQCNMNGNISTNGSFGPEKCKQYAQNQHVKTFTFHYNTLFFKKYQGYRKKWLENIEYLSKSKMCFLQIMIANTEFDYADILKIAEDYGLFIIWNLAFPPGETPFKDPKTSRTVGPKTEEFLLEAKARNIRARLVMSAPLCMFSREFLEKYKDEFALIKMCKPFVYFKPDLSMHHCSQMPAFSKSAPPKNQEDIVKVIRRQRKFNLLLKAEPTFPECRDCEYHLNMTCQGGCLTNKIYKDESTFLKWKEAYKNCS